MSYKLAALHFLKEREVARTRPSQSSRLGLKPGHLVPFPVLGPKRKWQSLYLLWLLISPKMCASCRAVCVLSKARCTALEEGIQPKLTGMRSTASPRNQDSSLPLSRSGKPRRLGLPKGRPIPPQPGQRDPP